MQPTWNCSSVTLNPSPSKVMTRNINASTRMAAILSLCTIEWLTCYNECVTFYLVPCPGSWDIQHMFHSSQCRFIWKETNILFFR